jgi:type I restriction enzyme S subunit
VKPYPDYKPSGVAWLGDVPGHWEVKAVRFVMSCNDEVLPEDTASGYELDYVEISDVDEISGLTGVESMLFKDAPSRARRIARHDDIIVSTVRTYLRAIAVVKNPPANFVVSTGFAVLRPQTVNAGYARYAVAHDGFIHEVIARSKGVSYPAINANELVRIALPVPPEDEQQAIADHLDTETARVDALVREKRGLVGLLQEFRQSVIADLTTGAHLPVRQTPTDDVFCPAIPSAWQMVRLGKYARIGNGSTPLKDNPGYWAGGTFPWLNSAVVNQDEVLEGSELVTDEALRACHLPVVQAGAVLVALTGQGKTRGQVTVLRITATINQHLAYLAADPSAFDTEYLFWTLSGMYAALRMVSDGQGGTKGALTCEDLSRFQVPKPPLAQQQAIAAQVKAETARVDDLIHHAQQEIALLKELRAATIADAVLGRVDLRLAQKTA